MIEHNKPTIGKEEQLAVSKVLQSGYLAEGIEVKEYLHATFTILSNIRIKRSSFFFLNPELNVNILKPFGFRSL